MKKYIITGILLIYSGLFAQGNLAQTGANFLQISVDPRGAALGDALTALTDGAEALYWNPAGMSRIENIDITLAHTDWFLDTKLAYGAVVKNFGSNIGAIGFSITSLYMDKMEITTVFDADGTGEYYEAGDIAIGLSYARQLTDYFTFGVTAKFVQEKIWDETAEQLAFDIGSTYQTNFLNIRLGMAIRNISGTLAFEGKNIDRRIKEEEELNIQENPRIERLSKDFRLPQVFQMNVAFEPVSLDEQNRITFIAGVDVPSDNEQRTVFATEYGFNDFAFLRAGYRMNYDAGALSFGLGLHTALMGVNGRLDYAYSEHGNLGDVHRFAFGISL